LEQAAQFGSTTSLKFSWKVILPLHDYAESHRFFLRCSGLLLPFA
jgi:hypothetical protein